MERDVVIRNSLGVHARPAAMFVQIASRFKAKILVERDGVEVNGKSIMGVLMLAAERGARLTLRADGGDAHDALAALAELVEVRMFDET
ncbi:HPr family phosphocarrier protein [Candidatus Fermentibacteria bacterium]|nr:HPr family phosphocarrier protein [Candidatus Fermentibacteria bacterium]